MKSALHQHARAAERDRLVDLAADLVERSHVSVGRAGPAVESAERADYVADVRVVDIAIDDVGDDVVGMTARADLVSGGAYSRYVVGFQERRAFFNGHAPAVEHSIENGLN